MESEHSHNEKVMYMLGEINSTLKSMDERLKIQNGRTYSNEKKIEELNTDIQSLKDFNLKLKTRAGLVSGGIAFLVAGGWAFIKEFIK